MADEKKKGLLSRIANKVFSVETFFVTIPTALVLGYVGNMYWDFGFFDVVHGELGLTPEGEQWRQLTELTTSWAHDLVGFTSGDGILQWDISKAFLDSTVGPFDLAAAAGPTPPPVTEVIAAAPTPTPAAPPTSPAPLQLAPPSISS